MNLMENFGVEEVAVLVRKKIRKGETVALPEMNDEMLE
jgi:hypothetical protein